MEERKLEIALEVLGKLRSTSINQKIQLEDILAHDDNGPITIGVCTLKLEHCNRELAYFQQQIELYTKMKEELA